MIYLLDTNAWISYLNFPASPIRKHLSERSPQEIATCSIVKAEFVFGAYRSARCDANLSLLKTLFEGIRSFPFDDSAIDFYGRIRADLSKRGSPIGPNDLLISAIALANNCVLITHNTSEFGMVPELIYEDWLI
jgi:tRNA(fMet)-specific endonuclease VapC